MTKGELLYEGKGKKLFKTENEQLLISEFKDDLTAFDAKKRGNEAGKGTLNCKISTAIFRLLEKHGIKTHLVETISESEQLIKKVAILPIEVVVRNIATGSLTKKFGIKEGTNLPFSIVEFYYKDDSLSDPLINDEHALILNLAKDQRELDELKKLGREINDILRPFFLTCGLKLVDFKVEFGKDENGEILLSDEISPDSCRFWDEKTNEKLDKDRFRQDLGSVKVAYEEVLKRILQKV